MTDVDSVAARHAELVGPGSLILVVGPSGAGKDTLIDLAKVICSSDNNVVFPQRIVTREASAFENNEAVSPTKFGQMLAHGDFAFQWEAHGLRYGLPNSIADDVRAGRVVVINVSRTIVESARRSYANVTVVLISAPSDVLARRIEARARSTDGKAGDRLRRTVVTVIPDKTINNVGPIDSHAAELVEIIKGT